MTCGEKLDCQIVDQIGKIKITCLFQGDYKIGYQYSPRVQGLL